MKQQTADAIWGKLNSLWVQELGKLEMRTYLNSLVSEPSLNKEKILTDYYLKLLSETTMTDYPRKKAYTWLAEILNAQDSECPKCHGVGACMVCRPWQGSINTQPESENKVTWPTVVKWEGDLPDLENESELLIRPDAPATLYSFERKDNKGIIIIDEVEITKWMIDKYIEHFTMEADPVITRELKGIFESCKSWLDTRKGES